MPADRSRVAFALTRRGPAWVREAAAVGLGFTAVAIAMTWPLVLHLGTRIPGGGTFYDPTGYYYDFWYFATHGLQLFGPGTMSILDAPFGRPIVPSTLIQQLVSYGPGVGISALWSPAAGLSIVALASLAGSGGAMYGLIRWLGAGRIAAVWAGLALMFSPYLTYRVGVHIPLANIACMPLTVLACLAWMERLSPRRALWVALALVFAWLTNPYYGFMCLVIAIVICAIGLGAEWRRHGFGTALRGLGALVAWVGGLVVVPLLVLLVTSGSAVQSALTRRLTDLSLYGAHVTDYIWPSHASHLMGWLFGAAWRGTPGGETTVFLGWSTIVLAIGWAIVAWRRWESVSPRMRHLSAVAGPLIVVLVLMSLASPYRIAGVSIDTPSYFVWKIVPFIRSYGRFGGAVMVVVAALAALGVDALVARFSRRDGLLVAGALIAISVLELPVALPIASAPPLVPNGAHSAPASQFAAWRWLAAQPHDGVLIEQPTSSIEHYPYRGYLDRIYMYGQTLHHWPLVNGGLGEGSLGDQFGRLVGDPRTPESAANLATAGVTTVIVNPWAFSEAGLVPPDTSNPPPGYAAVHRYPDGTAIWRVTAPAQPGIVVFNAGFEPTPPGDVWVVEGRSGTATAYAPAGGTFAVEFSATSRGLPGAVTVAVGRGRATTDTLAPGVFVRIRIPLQLASHEAVPLTLRRRAASGAGLGPEVITQGWRVVRATAP